jgi:propanol-preferring alcohol dehydrogenase
LRIAIFLLVDAWIFSAAGGGLGHLGLQFATTMGLRVSGIDTADRPFHLAESIRTDADVVDARTVSADELLIQIGEDSGNKGNPGLGAVKVLPESQVGFDYGMRLLRNHRLCMVVSIPVDGFQVSAVDIVSRDIKVHGSILGTRATLVETVPFATRHGVKAVNKTFPLDRLDELVDEYQQGNGGKFVVDMSL